MRDEMKRAHLLIPLTVVLCIAACLLAVPIAQAAEGTCAILYRDGTLVVQEGDVPDAARGEVWKTFDGLSDTTYDGADNMPPWTRNWSGQVEKVVFDGGAPSSTAHWFESGVDFRTLKNLKQADLSGIDASRLTDSTAMFASTPISECTLAGITFPALERADYMFFRTKLATANLAGSSMPKLTSATSMYARAAVRSADLTDFFAPSLVSTREMFASTSIGSVNSAGAHLPALSDATEMFARCYMKSIDISSLTAGSLRTCDGMFRECGNLVTVDVSGLDTSSLETCARMFLGCCSLEAVRGLSTWKASSLQSCSRMFDECSALKRVDFSGWAPKNLVHAKGMFHWCPELRCIVLGPGFSQIPAHMLSGMRAKKCNIVVQSKKLTKKRVSRCAKRWRHKEVLIAYDRPDWTGDDEDFYFYRAPKIKAVKVQVGSKKANKAYARKYKSLFTKKACGSDLKIIAAKKALKK